MEVIRSLNLSSYSIRDVVDDFLMEVVKEGLFQFSNYVFNEYDLVDEKGNFRFPKDFFGDDDVAYEKWQEKMYEIVEDLMIDFMHATWDAANKVAEEYDLDQKLFDVFERFFNEDFVHGEIEEMLDWDKDGIAKPFDFYLVLKEALNSQKGYKYLDEFYYDVWDYIIENADIKFKNSRKGIKWVIIPHDLRTYRLFKVGSSKPRLISASKMDKFLKEHTYCDIVDECEDLDSFEVLVFSDASMEVFGIKDREDVPVGSKFVVDLSKMGL